MSKKKFPIGVLISGRGSNLKAIVKQIELGHLDAEIKIVISNKPQAQGLAFAEEHHIPTRAVRISDFSSKDDYELEVVRLLNEAGVQLVVLAGYIRVLGPAFIDAFRGRIVNIHPSLLPAFKGLHAQRQALEYGVKLAGCSVHYVDESLDGGKIIMQTAVPVLDGDTEDTLSNRILEQEHILFSKAIQHHIQLERKKNESIN